jgi:hypothetical protein
MSQSPELLMRMANLRQKARAGTMTIDEVREGVRLLREDRVGASAASTKARVTKSKAAAVIDSDALLKELEGDLGL